MQPNSPTDAELVDVARSLSREVLRMFQAISERGPKAHDDNALYFLAALKDVERRTAERCAEITRGYIVPSADSDDELFAAPSVIRKEFHLD